jgi:hypothetical protein
VKSTVCAVRSRKARGDLKIELARLRTSWLYSDPMIADVRSSILV